jgi:hypothetical protein
LLKNFKGRGEIPFHNIWEEEIMGKRLFMAFMLFLAIILISLNFLMDWNKKNHIKKIDNINARMEEIVFDEVLPLKIIEADALSKKIKQDILNVFSKDFKDKTLLKKEIQDVLSGTIEKSIAFDKMNSVVYGKTLNGIKGKDQNGREKSDRNDIIIIIRDPIKGVFVIALDLSFDCVTEDRIRIKEVERNGKNGKGGQFAKKLFDKAFDDITLKGKSFTFWSYAEPLKESFWYEDVRNFESTELGDLRAFFRKYDYDYKSLYSFEFLVSNRINDKEDYFGVKSLNYNGSYTKEDMTIIITSGFNIIDQMSDDQINKLERYKLDKDNENKI